MKTKITKPDLSKKNLYQIMPYLDIIARFYDLTLVCYEDFHQAVEIYSSQLN